MRFGGWRRVNYAYFHLVQFLVIASFLFSWVAGIFYIFCADRLIRFEYKYHKDEWLIDGQPCGYFWKPKEVSIFFTGFKHYYCTEKWLKETPEWIQNDAKAIHLLNRLRFSKKLAYFSLTVCGGMFIVFLIFKKAGFEI